MEQDNYVYPGQRIASNGYKIGYGQGMTLRDWFAGLAGEADIESHMKGEIISSSPYAYGETVLVDKYTREQARYRYADAMLDARK